MFRKLFSRNTTDLAALVQGHFIEVKALYALQFDAVPCVSFIGELDMTLVLEFMNSHYIGVVKSVYEHAYFDHATQQMLFNNKIVVLNGKRMVELGTNYVQVLHTPFQYNWAHSLIKELAHFRLVPHEPVIGFARAASVN